MVKMTMIACVTDGLPLAEGLDDGRDLVDAEMYKQQVKALFKNLSNGHNEASRMSIETGPYIFHYMYIIEGRVCYLTMCDLAYPKKLAFQYLEDLKNEFERVNGAQIETAARPYAFIKFGELLFLILGNSCLQIAAIASTACVSSPFFVDEAVHAFVGVFLV